MAAAWSLRVASGCAGDILRYHHVVADILIRGVPETVVSAIDSKAASVGLSRVEYLRRVLLREQADPSGEVTIESLERFADMFSDLTRPDVMADAWS